MADANASLRDKEKFHHNLSSGKDHQPESCTALLEDGDEAEEDQCDALPAVLRYSNLDLACTLVSVATYMLDLAMDVVVAVYFYHLGVTHGIYHYWYFGLSLAFILVPSLTMTGFSFRWYLKDADNPQLPDVSLTRWVLRLVVLVLQLAPILRYVDSIRCGLLSRWFAYKAKMASDNQDLQMQYREKSKTYYILMVYEDADATLLRLFECFMESAPQLVLQIYILIKDPHAVKLNDSDTVGDSQVDPITKITILIVSVMSSLVSLAWSLVVYHRSLRYTYENKKNIGLAGSICQFLWHFSSITARVLALSLFASAHPQWIGPVIGANWTVMTSWLVFQQTEACNNRVEEFLFCGVLGVIYTFSFFNAKEEPTRYKYLAYYGFCFAENTVLVGLWFVHADSKDLTWYFYPGIVAHYLTFFAGVFFMVLYYACFHPTGVRPISWRRLFKTEKNRTASVHEVTEPEAETPEKRPPPEVLDLRETVRTYDDGDTCKRNNNSASTPTLDEMDSSQNGAKPVERDQAPHPYIRRTLSAPTADPTIRAVIQIPSTRTFKSMGSDR